MNISFRKPPLTRGALAFSLVEMLVVIAIIAIMTALIAPAFTNIGKASNLTDAGSVLVDNLTLARQTALAKNASVEVRFYNIADAASTGPVAYRAFRLLLNDNAGGTNKPITRLIRFPVATIMVPDQKFSTILSDLNPFGSGTGGGDSLPGISTPVPSKSVRFLPDGSTSLNPSGASGDKWFVSIRSETATPRTDKPADNYVTVELNPASGRVRTYRP